MLSFKAEKEDTFPKTQAPGAAKALSKSLLKEYSKSEAVTFLPFPFFQMEPNRLETF